MYGEICACQRKAVPLLRNENESCSVAKSDRILNETNMWWRSVIWTGIVFGTFFALIPSLLWLVSWCVGRLFSYRLLYAPFGWTALVLVIFLWCALCYEFVRGRFLSEVNQVTFTSPEVPEAFDGFRIVHISDLHVNSFETPADLQRVLSRVNEARIIH